MDRLLRHGIDAKKKTAFNAKRLSIGAVLFVWVLSTLACAQGYLTPVELTATAQSNPVQVRSTSTQLPPTGQPTRAATLLQTTAGIGSGSSDPPEIAATQNIANTPAPTFTPTVLPTKPGTPLPPILYNALPGDTLPALSIRFGVSPEEITSTEPIPSQALIQAGQLLLIPNRLSETGPADTIVPDSEIVFSPSALDFDIEAFVNEAGGYLSTYKEYLGNGWNTGAQVVRRVAVENSINPRLLLALLEYQSHWLYGQPSNLAETEYPLGWVHLDKKGLFKQLNWAMQKVSLGYYGWRDGTVISVTFPDGSSLRMEPRLNAGSAAMQYYFSQLNEQPVWSGMLSGDSSFAKLYERMFGNPWLRAQTVEPLLPLNLTQPALELPFLGGRYWSLTGGPHAAWAKDGARAAIDFAPASTVSGCVTSADWIASVAPGLVVRSADGVVVVDLDGDGYEQTGWSILYLHVASKDRVKVGTVLEQDSLIGHPSCEGGSSTGTHVHIARKYNGEWVLAGGPLPFNLSGWIAHAGANPYEGSMTRGDQEAVACTCGSFETRIQR